MRAHELVLVRHAASPLPNASYSAHRWLCPDRYFMCSPLHRYGALPGDARVVHTAGRRVGRTVDEYAGSSNTPAGLAARAEYALDVARTGVLDPQLLGAAVVHRVPTEMMRFMHARLVRQVQAAVVGGGGAGRLEC